jgi:hypothetical protein
MFDHAGGVIDLVGLRRRDLDARSVRLDPIDDVLDAEPCGVSCRFLQDSIRNDDIRFNKRR